MENKRGWWWFLSIVSFPVLFLALRGSFGEEAKEQAEVAFEDWSRMARSPLGYAILIVIAIVVVAAIVLLLYQGTR
jgi:hypothetical protein